MNLDKTKSSKFLSKKCILDDTNLKNKSEKANYKKLAKKIINEILDFIYPENITCVLCDSPIKKQNTYSLCKDCFNELYFIVDGCLRCGKNIVNHNLEETFVEKCDFCKSKKFYFNRNISCIEYTKLSKRFVFNLKYQNKTYMAKYIAQIMYDKLLMENIKCDYILCVPLHKKRLRKRGFNQAEKIAKYLSEYTKVEFLDIIKRNKNTKRLYTLGEDDRKKELQSVFEIDSGVDLKSKDVLIVDDIFTTGSTVNEISKILRILGVNKICTITLITKSV